MNVGKITLEYHIKSYECDCNGNLRLLTLMNIFQDVADTHASKLGVGMEHCQAHGLAWVGSNYIIEIEKMPRWHEKITVTSWPSVEKKLGAIRDFEVRNENNEIVIRATSQWILIDFAKRRPVSLRDNLPEYQVVNERALDLEFARLAEPERVDYKQTFQVRFDDIDINKHVNNAVYPLWATEALPHNFRQVHMPKTIEIAFKKEGLYGENVVVSSQIDQQTSLHAICAENDNRELAKVKIIWH